MVCILDLCLPCMFIVHEFFYYLIFLTFFFLWQTIALKSGALRHDIHYWVGKDTSQVNLYCILLTSIGYPATIVSWPSQLCLNRMKLVLQQSRPSNWMQLLVVVLFSIVKYKAMKRKSSFLILNHVLYLKKVEFHLVLIMWRLRSTLRGCLFAKESMLFK